MGIYREIGFSSSGAPLKISQLFISDIADVSEIERLSSPNPWTLNQFREELDKSFSHGWVVRNGQKPIAFLVLWLIAGEGQVANLGVHPRCRRHGVAASLLKRAEDFLFTEKAPLMTLEVRSENKPARRLYQKAGYAETGKRLKYYENREDAILMEKRILIKCG